MVLRQDREVINVQRCELFRPQLKVGDKVKFYNEATCKNWVGTIKTIELVDSYFSSAVIHCLGYKGETCQVKVSKIEYINFLSSGG